MNKPEAIETVQDIIDVANAHGSACIYKHNRGVEKMQNVLDCLKNSEPVKGYWKHKTRHFGGFRDRTGIDEHGETVTIRVDERWEENMPYCSVCGMFTEEIPDPKYCPHCGARMAEV